MSGHQDQSSDWSKNSAICSPNGSIGLGLCFYLQTLGCKSRERNHGKLCLDKPCGMHSLSKLSISVRLSVILLPFVPPNGLFPLGKRCWYAFFPEPVLQYEAGFIILLYFNQIIVYSSYLIWGLYLLLLYLTLVKVYLFYLVWLPKCRRHPTTFCEGIRILKGRIFLNPMHLHAFLKYLPHTHDWRILSSFPEEFCFYYIAAFLCLGL